MIENMGLKKLNENKESSSSSLLTRSPPLKTLITKNRNITMKVCDDEVFGFDNFFC